MLTSMVTRYYVTADGIVQRTLWGYSMYKLEKGASLIKFNDSSDGDAWGLCTQKENILISPIITDYKDMLSELQKQCREKSVPIIK